MHFAARLAPFGTTIFTEINRLALAHDAVNLGQGRPDFDGPQSMLQAAADAMLSGQANQYPPGTGIGRLRHALVDHARTFYNLDVDPRQGVIVTVGATEGVYAAVMGVVNPGDEVILIEPYYDTYLPAIAWVGGVPVYVPMQPPSWRFDPAALRAAFNDKTRAIIINTPHNPTGKVFSRAEFELIAELCQEFDVIAVVDEVYEHILFNDRSHLCLASFPGMRDRTVTISSLGKTFSATGWKVGWTIAQPELNTAIFRAHQFVTFSGASPLQEAAAIALESADSRGYYDSLHIDYAKKRRLLLNALADVGLNAIPPDGTYFVMVDISDLPFENDVAFCRYLTSEIGVAAIPPSAFYANPADGAGLARFTFCKKEETLFRAAERLKKLKR